MSGVNRVKSIDIAKGVGIILVVLGHQIDYFHADISGAYQFIYLFHVPLFFFLSGLFIRESEGLWDCIKKKFFRIYLPYLLVNVLFFFWEMFRAWKMGSAYDGELVWRNMWLACAGLWPVPSMLSRPSWFILILFRISIIYKLMQILTGNRKLIMFAISAVIGVLGAVYAPKAYMLGQTMVALPFLSLGHICGVGLVEKENIFASWQSIVGALLALPLLYIISLHQQTNIAVNVYDNAVLMFGGALLGIMAVLWISKLLERLSITTNVLTFIGRNTLSILLWHMIIMKVLFTLAEYAGFERHPLTYIVAFAAAVVVSCAMSQMYSIIKSRIWSR